MHVSGWWLLDAMHFSRSLTGILYSLIVFDKCKHFISKEQLLQFITTLCWGLLAGESCGYSLPLAVSEVTRLGASGTKLSAPTAAPEELILLACSYNLWMLNSVPYMLSLWSFTPFLSIASSSDRWAYLGVVTSTTVTARITVIQTKNIVLRYEAL